MTQARRAFSLVELLLAVYILGIGIIGISALFPAGIAQQRQANDDIIGPIVADNALAILRTKLNPEWFGTMEEFGLRDLMTPNGGAVLTHTYTIPGDWEWKRPGFIFSNLTGAAFAATEANETGTIDIFSALLTNKQLGGTIQSGLNLAKTASENFDGDGGSAPVFAPLYGIPYSRRGFDQRYSDLNPEVVHPDAVPLVLISQAERSYPNGVAEAYPPNPPNPAPLAGQSINKRPAYFWECMFRRFAGRIQVAVFVYRVTDGGGEPRQYSTSQSVVALTPTLPPLPILADVNALPFAPWKFGGLDGTALTLADNATVRTPAPAATPTAIAPELSWQAPSQWILDEYNTVHRVLLGRKTNRDGAVAMTRPIPPQPPLPELFGTIYANGVTNGSIPIDPGARFIWFIPTSDPRGFSLTPVYITVQEL